MEAVTNRQEMVVLNKRTHTWNILRSIPCPWTRQELCSLQDSSGLKQAGLYSQPNLHKSPYEHLPSSKIIKPGVGCDSIAWQAQGSGFSF